jgi:hypothetical protein
MSIWVIAIATMEHQRRVLIVYNLQEEKNEISALWKKL